MTLSHQDVKKIAGLARIKITDQEVDKVAYQLSSIMDWIDQLRNVDTSSLDNQIACDQPLMHEREDVVTEPNQVDEILLNAPASQHHMFAVPKMVES
jgi:aspartyl-tRNA(Asn)/glutamyl-tRNA(Gln) amidotransferase subunit C